MANKTPYFLRMPTCIYVTTPTFVLATVSSLGKRPLSRVSAHPPQFSFEGLSVHGRLRGILRYIYIYNYIYLYACGFKNKFTSSFCEHHTDYTMPVLNQTCVYIG